MKVKSFVVGVVEGVDRSMKRLDEQVEQLGDVTIHSVTDTVYSAVLNRAGRPPDELIVRVVVYTPRV